jgi:hypothetical protein
VTDLSRHCSFLLDLLALEGPHTKQQLEQIFAQLGEGASSLMEQALRLLVNSGSVLEDENSTVYFVAPARLIPRDQNAGSYMLLGHPGAENILRYYGKIMGPDERGVRRFFSKTPVQSLERRILDFGISIRRH